MKPLSRSVVVSAVACAPGSTNRSSLACSATRQLLCGAYCIACGKGSSLRHAGASSACMRCSASACSHASCHRQGLLQCTQLPVLYCCSQLKGSNVDACWPAHAQCSAQCQPYVPKACGAPIEVVWSVMGCLQSACGLNGSSCGRHPPVHLQVDYIDARSICCCNPPCWQSGQAGVGVIDVVIAGVVEAAAVQRQQRRAVDDLQTMRSCQPRARDCAEGPSYGGASTARHLRRPLVDKRQQLRGASCCGRPAQARVVHQAVRRVAGTPPRPWFR